MSKKKRRHGKQGTLGSVYADDPNVLRVEGGAVEHDRQCTYNVPLL
jgi:hypothetical protein